MGWAKFIIPLFKYLMVEPIKPSREIPQESVLNPKLLIYYINEILEKIHKLFEINNSDIIQEFIE